jgi:plasmid stabilization system protein ParE
MSGYAFHPDALADLDEIWEYIAQDNVDAADGVLADIHTVLRTLAASPHIGHRRPRSDSPTIAISRRARRVPDCLRTR